MQVDTAAVVRLRWELGVSQESLAEKAGISELTLNRLEQGKAQPRVTTVKKLADALGVPVADILANTEAVAS